MYIINKWACFLVKFWKKRTITSFSDLNWHSSFELVQFWRSLKNLLLRRFSKLPWKPYYSVQKSDVHSKYRFIYFKVNRRKQIEQALTRCLNKAREQKYGRTRKLGSQKSFGNFLSRSKDFEISYSTFHIWSNDHWRIIGPVD